MGTEQDQKELKSKLALFLTKEREELSKVAPVEDGLDDLLISGMKTLEKVAATSAAEIARLQKQHDQLFGRRAKILALEIEEDFKKTLLAHSWVDQVNKWNEEVLLFKRQVNGIEDGLVKLLVTVRESIFLYRVDVDTLESVLNLLYYSEEQTLRSNTKLKDAIISLARVANEFGKSASSRSKYTVVGQKLLNFVRDNC